MFPELNVIADELPSLPAAISQRPPDAMVEPTGQLPEFDPLPPLPPLAPPPPPPLPPLPPLPPPLPPPQLVAQTGGIAVPAQGLAYVVDAVAVPTLRFTPPPSGESKPPLAICTDSSVSVSEVAVELCWLTATVTRPASAGSESVI
jgi:hypothetical protein